MESIRMVFTKWGERPHWEYDTELLGDDEHGRWLGLREGSEVARPGARITTREAQVVLVPDAAYVATFYDDGSAPCEVYVDISSVPSVEPGRVTAVDLDLDVIRGRTGRVWVDDEDEFADHRLRYGYPDEVVEEALVSCAGVRAALDDRRPPFDGVTARRWLDRIAASPGPGSGR